MSQYVYELLIIGFGFCYGLVVGLMIMWEIWKVHEQ